MIGKFAIKKAPFEENVAALKSVLEDGDTVIAAGGDATAAVSANAILESGKDVTLGVLPYGNFNDLARTLRVMDCGEMLRHLEESIGEDGRVAEKALSKGLRLGRAPRSGPRKSFSDRPRLYPLDIIVDGVHWRYATCYVTIGMTAEAVELFDKPKIRKALKKGHRSSWRSYLHLAGWYFKHRHKKVFLPEFTVNGQPVVKKASDYAAVNGRSMCRVMKGGDDFLRPKVFRSKVAKLTSFPRLTKLMMASMFKRVPGVDTNGDTIEFKAPATIELQAEGEYHIFENVKTIRIEKPNKKIKVIMKGRK